MELICKAEFKDKAFRSVTGKFAMTQDGFVTMVAFIRVAMQRGATRTTISDGAVSVSIVTSQKWIAMDGLKMLAEVINLLEDAIETQQEAAKSARTASALATEALLQTESAA
jgi:regulator of PEP synthase PpsR (kinase-PPPase family)